MNVYFEKALTEEIQVYQKYVFLVERYNTFHLKIFARVLKGDKSPIMMHHTFLK